MLRFVLLDGFGQTGHHLKSIPYNTVIRRLEEGRFGVAVDDDDIFRGGDASQMLNCPRNATAIYRLGEIWMPVCPTCSWWGRQPTSATGLEQAVAAPKLSPAPQ